MMPHPDRSSELLLGSADGFPIFQSMIAFESTIAPVATR
jgi:phosphoribosylformylglycinamidine (FGAM) synthase-like amidotransferase family enzyme